MIWAAPGHNRSPPTDGNGKGGDRQDRNPDTHHEPEPPQWRIESTSARSGIQIRVARRERSTPAKSRLGTAADCGSAVVGRDSKYRGGRCSSFVPIKPGLLQCFEVITLHSGVMLAHNRSSGHQDKIDRLGKISLMETKCFTHQTSGTRANRCVPYLATGDHSQTAGRRRGKGYPVQDQTTLNETTALHLGPAKITPLLNTPFPGKSQRRGR